MLPFSQFITEASYSSLITAYVKKHEAEGDISDIEPALMYLKELSVKYPTEKRTDIGYWMSKPFVDLQTWLAAVKADIEVRTPKYVSVLSNEQVSVSMPLNYAGARLLGRKLAGGNCRWCISNDESEWADYTNSGSYFLFVEIHDSDGDDLLVVQLQDGIIIWDEHDKPLTSDEYKKEDKARYKSSMDRLGRVGLTKDVMYAAAEKHTPTARPEYSQQ